MPITVAGVEAEILSRVGGKWALAQLSPLVDGTNPDLKAPIRKGLRYVGVTPADPMAATDADLLTVPVKRAEVYFDAATLEALYACQGRMPHGFDQQVEQEKQALSQIMDQLAAMIGEYKTRVPKPNTPAAQSGSLSAGAAIPNDDLRRCGVPTNPWTWPYPQ